MSSPDNNQASTELTLIAVIFIVVLLVSPLTSWWAALDAPWFSPYLVWSIAIFISWLLQHYLRSD